ncbi:lipopolysaccharide biosynthesis protein [Ponticaulis sp.]|uniref:lipopolysaccharide biosynthesis protein n=1 Tax=Ponticaulis sp. TaxID=2020902 RepID=UPI0025EDE906|nr:lipopolysaccharide biosynthesis protein [Ponticaulis sp.]
MPKSNVENSFFGKAFGGAVWLLSGGITRVIIKTVVLAILARILTPADFGVLGACMTLFAFTEVFMQLGVAPALVQKENLSEQDIHTGLLITVSLSVLFAGGVFWLSPDLASFFSFPDLQAPFQVVALTFPLIALGTVSGALLQRNLKFKLIAMIEVSSYAFGYGLVSVSLALAQWGFWALIVGQVAQFVLRNFLLFVASKHSLSFHFDVDSARSLLNFGVGATLARIFNYFAANGDYLVVGRTLGVDYLGLYTRAYFLIQQPANLIGQIVNNVLFPILSVIKSDIERVIRIYQGGVFLVFLSSGLGSVLLFFSAKEIVLLLLGEQWTSLVLPFQILLIGLPFRIAYKIGNTVIKASGAVYMLALWQFCYAVLIIAGAFYGARYGLNGVAAFVTGAMILGYFLNITFVKLVFPLPLLSEALILIKVFVLASALSIFLYSLSCVIWFEQLPLVFRLAMNAIVTLLFIGVTFPFLRNIFGVSASWILDRGVGTFRAKFLKSRS